MANSESGCALTRFCLIMHISSYVACAHMHMNVRCVVQSRTLYPYGCQMEGASPFISTNDKISAPFASHSLISGVVCYIHFIWFISYILGR